MKHLLRIFLFVLVLATTSLEATADSGDQVVVGGQPATGLILTSAEAGKAATKARIQINCDQGRSLQRTIDRLRIVNPLVIEFSGVCEENILVARDDLTVRGVDEGATVKGHFDVQGASRIRLEDFTIRDSVSEDRILDREGDGLRIVSGMKVSVDDVTVINAGSRGISVEGSSVEFRNTIVLDSLGINVVWIGSTIVVYEHFVSRGSQVNGIVVFNATDIFVRPGALLESDENPGGLAIQAQSSLTLGVDAKISVKNNLSHGLLLIGEGTLLYSSAAIEARGNGGFGIGIADLSHLSPFGGSIVELDLSENVFGGVAVVRRSVARFQDGTVIENNVGSGIVVDDSSLLIGGIVSRGNGGGDALFFFGSHISAVTPNDIATPVICDDTVLLRGPITCEVPPAPAPVGSPGEIDFYQGLPEISREAMRALHAMN